jgi:NLR family CARD domain-containing protein 3
MFLCSLLTKPGDGRFSNYILDFHNLIYCIDNDIAFVEPVVRSAFFQKINFCSVLFCLFPKRSLDAEVLRKFCDLDVDAILNGWIEDVIEQETAYMKLFSELERERLYEEDLDNRFKATILFREGALALLNLQFCHLQNFLRSVLSQNKKLLPIDLLEQIITIQVKQTIDNSSGMNVSKAYKKALLQPVEKRIETVIPRNQSLKSYESDQACLGKIPSLEEIEKKELFTPAKAREELFMTLLIKSGDFISEGLVQGKKMIRVSFKNMKQGEEPDQERQALVLQALIHFMQMEQTRPTSVALHHYFCGRHTPSLAVLMLALRIALIFLKTIDVS